MQGRGAGCRAPFVLPRCSLHPGEPKPQPKPSMWLTTTPGGAPAPPTPLPSQPPCLPPSLSFFPLPLLSLPAPGRPRADNGAHQHDGEALLQLSGLGHGQLEGRAVCPQLRLLRVHAPRVAHGGGGPAGPSALPPRSAAAAAAEPGGLGAPRSPSSTAGGTPWLAALVLALPPGRARSGSGCGSCSSGPGSPACRPAHSPAPLRPRPAVRWDS